MNETLIPHPDRHTSQQPPASPVASRPAEQERGDHGNPWKLALESSGDGVWDWNVVTGDQTHSRRWAEMLGYAADEIGPGFHEFSSRVHPDDRLRVQAASKTCLEGHSPSYAVDLRLRCKDGSWKWILSRGMVVSRDPQGKPLRMIGTHTDITERKQAEEALRQSHQRFSDLVESTDGIVWEADATTFVFNYVSGNAERMLGYPVADWLIPGFWADHIYAPDREQAVQYCVACTGQLDDHDFAYRFVASDGRLVWLRDIVKVVEVDGKARWLRGLMVDITASKVADATARESEYRWKFAIEGSGDGLWDWDVAAGTVFYSRRWKEMLGFTEDEIGNTLAECLSRIHAQDKEQVLADMQAHFDGTTPLYISEHRVLSKDGSWKWILDRGLVVSRDEQGKPLRMVGTHTDISGRKQTEAELRALNQQLGDKTQLLQTTLASISQGIFMIDADQRVSTFNPRVCDLLDVPESFLATRPTLQELGLYQHERGDFGPDAQLLDEHARSYMAAGGKGVIPARYLRVTQDGRTLEVKTQTLSGGGMVRTFADVSDYVQAETARKRLNLLLDATQSIARVGGWEADMANDTVFWTEGVYRILETSAQVYTPTPATTRQFFTAETRALIKASYADPVKHARTHDLELEMITARGRHIWVHSMSTTTWAQGRAVKRTAVLQDITERKQAEAALRDNEQRWKLALESTGDGVWDWYVQTGEEFFSKRLMEMYGFDEGEILNRATALDALTHPDDRAQVERDRQAHFDGLAPTYVNEHRVRCKDGHWKWVLTRGMVISRDGQGAPLRMIGTHTDITERKRSEALIWQQAHFDTLTGLPNRNMLRDRLAQEIKKSRRDAQQLAILFIDLDHFKEVNDTLGHDRGDLLLVEAARRIRDCVRECDTVARMGGDEFTVILTEVLDSSSLERILQKLLAALETKFQLGDEQVFVSASIGITMYPLDGTEIEDLLKNADQALYVAKGAGRNRFSFFTPALQEAAQTRVRLANDLRAGLTNQQFVLVYQPIVELASGAIHKAEALIRWQHPTRGLISPAAFIPIAEASGLIVDIGEWVFQQAARQVQQWRSALHPHFQISVNKSPVQFQHDGRASPPWGSQLQTMGLPGDSIVVEITEGLLLDTSSGVADQLLALHDAGIQVSLDDFGTGYSSLSYLQKFDIDFIKIDQSFVRHLIADSTDLALCKAIIVMAHELGMKVIAEGVETTLQRELLSAAGCDYAQGYLFARPMSAPDFEAFMAAR